MHSNIVIPILSIVEYGNEAAVAVRNSVSPVNRSSIVARNPKQE